MKKMQEVQISPAVSSAVQTMCLFLIFLLGNVLSPAPIPPCGRKLNPSSGKTLSPGLFFINWVLSDPAFFSRLQPSSQRHWQDHSVGWEWRGCIWPLVIMGSSGTSAAVWPMSVPLPDIPCCLLRCVVLTQPLDLSRSAGSQSYSQPLRTTFSCLQGGLVPLPTHPRGWDQVLSAPWSLKPTWTRASFLRNSHQGLMLPIASPPNCRIFPSARRKSLSSFIRLSSKCIVLGIAFVFLGDSVLVFKPFSLWWFPPLWVPTAFWNSEVKCWVLAFALHSSHSNPTPRVVKCWGPHCYLNSKERSRTWKIKTAGEWEGQVVYHAATERFIIPE